MNRKTFLLGAGFVLAIVGTVSAGQRSRSSERTVNSATAEVSAPAAKAAPGSVVEIAPGVAQATINGQQQTVRANGMLGTQELIEQYGSLERAIGQQHIDNMRSGLGQDGEIVLADNSVGFYRDLIGPNAPVKPHARNVEEYKQQMRYSETTVGGQTVTVFADGSIGHGMVAMGSSPATIRRNVEGTNNGDERIWADGAIGFGSGAQ